MEVEAGTEGQSVTPSSLRSRSSRSVSRAYIAFWSFDAKSSHATNRTWKKQVEILHGGVLYPSEKLDGNAGSAGDLTVMRV